jgi:hypothetical protein
MKIPCDVCGKWFDDATRKEECPHESMILTVNQVLKSALCVDNQNSSQSFILNRVDPLDDQRLSANNVALPGLLEIKSLGAWRSDHPCHKPLKLTQWLATLLLPAETGKPRRLLIPFSGSGSEIIGAMLAGWDEIVAVEMDQHYVDIAVARITHHDQKKEVA